MHSSITIIPRQSKIQTKILPPSIDVNRICLEMVSTFASGPKVVQFHENKYKPRTNLYNIFGIAVLLWVFDKTILVETPWHICILQL